VPPVTTLDDPGILRPMLDEALRGDRGALHALMELLATSHYRRIVGFLRKHTSARTQTIEVAFQDSMVRFHELVDEGRVEVRGDVLNWIMWFCLRTLRNARKARITPAHPRNWKRLSDVLDTLESRRLAEPAAIAARKEAQEWLRRATDELPPRMRQVLNLRLEDVSAPDIAQRLGIAVKTVYDLQEKARARILTSLASVARLQGSSRDRARAAEIVRRAMAQLPDDVREVLEALHVRGLSRRRVAKEFGARGDESVAALRDEGYRLLAGRLGVPFPETFDTVRLRPASRQRP
jgi:RNA polymerase sigma factor (sigma-70 family)